jgi:hypothetical protein
MASVGFLVGPGVLGHLDGLHALAERVGVAVINTWGAKGVFRWDSPFHGGTAGLQELDFELAGLDEVDLLLTSGLDQREVTSRPWEGRGVDVRTIEPHELGSYAWTLPKGDLARPRLYTELVAVVGPMYDDPKTPPAKLKALAEKAAPGSLVVAPPGLVGYWVARTWPTTEAGSVVVPADPDPAVAQKAAADAAAAGRKVTYVGTAKVDLPGVTVVLLKGDLRIPQPLLDVAGPLVAWT